MSTVVTIIGGGFCGALTGIHLLRLGSPELSVRVIERSGRFGPGLPYVTDDLAHLLNVPAGNMSAFPDQPDHFIDYLRCTEARAGPADFVPRRTYGEYLASLVESARVEFSERLSLVTGEAVSVLRGGDNGRHVIHLSDARRFTSDAIVFALGHDVPRPLLPGAAVRDTPILVEDPWLPRALARLHGCLRVLVVGTGLTALDVCLSIVAGSPDTSIDVWSRHGLLPISHRTPVLRPRPVDASVSLLEGRATVREYAHRLRSAIRRAQDEGADWRDVIAGLRPNTPALWRRLPVEERRRFLRHARRLWDAHRHRCAPESRALLGEAIRDGRVSFAAGRIVEIGPQGARWVVRILRRHTENPETLTFDAIVNCTGPGTDLAESTDPLVTFLVRAGFMRPDVCRVGVEADQRYRPLHGDGGTTATWFHVGPGLRASEWEAIAVPELRTHVRNVAREVLSALETGMT